MALTPKPDFDADFAKARLRIKDERLLQMDAVDADECIDWVYLLLDALAA